MANKEELRKKRQKARRRKQAVFFGAAGIVCLVLIVVIARGILDLRAEEQAAREKQNQEAAAKEPETEKSQKAQENQDEETLDTVPVEEEDMGVSAQVTISAAGDFTLGTDENFDYSTSLPARYEEVQDPGYFLQNVKDIFASDDLTIVNLEGPLTTSEERADKQFSFKGDPSYTGILTSGSVEACNLTIITVRTMEFRDMKIPSPMWRLPASKRSVTKGQRSGKQTA